MKLTRRGAMGALTGAAVIGPKEMTKAAQQFVNQVPPPSTGLYDEAEKSIALSQNIENEIKRLTKVVAGDFTDHHFGYQLENDNKHHRLAKNNLCVDSLKSVSSPHKQQMHRDNTINWQKKNYIEDAKERLALLTRRKLGDLLG